MLIFKLDPGIAISGKVSGNKATKVSSLPIDLRDFGAKNANLTVELHNPWTTSMVRINDSQNVLVLLRHARKGVSMTLMKESYD